MEEVINKTYNLTLNSYLYISFKKLYNTVINLSYSNIQDCSVKTLFLILNNISDKIS